MNNSVKIVSCRCPTGCQYKSWNKVPGCMLRDGPCDEDLLLGVPLVLHPELTKQPSCFEEKKRQGGKD